MAFGLFKILKGLRIVQENSLDPKAIEIVPAGTTGTKTTLTSAQTVDRILTLPDKSDTLAGMSDISSGAAALSAHIANTSTHGVSGNIVGTDNTQTLTNKTLTAPVINNPTGIVKADVGLSNVDNTSDATKNAAAVSLTNKTIDADLNTITNIENADIKVGAAIDATKIANGSVDNTEFQYLDGVSSGIQGQLDSKALDTDLSTHISDLSTHGTTGDIVGTSDIQVLTNKDIDGGTASNTSRITVPKGTKAALDALTRKEGTIVYATDTDKFYADDGTVLKVVGSGSGGVLNFIEGGDAEAGTTGWVTYADAAGSRPVDGTGGSPTITWTTSATAPLNGTNSFLLTKGASNTQGQGASYTYSLPLEFRGKALSINLPYMVDSGTFTAGTASTDSDLIIYAYDITNSKLVEPSSIKLLSNSTSISDMLRAQIQFDSNCTSARFIIHCATTSASAYTVKFDDIVVSPSQYVFGTPVTDWTPVTLTGGWTTNTTYSAYKRRVGDSFEYNVAISLAGAPNAANLTINLDSTIDTVKLKSNELGVIRIGDSGVRDYIGHVLYNTATQVTLSYDSVSASTILEATVTNIAPFTFGASDFVHCSFKIPAVGLSSSVQMSDSSDTRVVAFQGYKSTNQSVTANVTDITFTSSVDTHGSWSGSSYTVPVAGLYDFSMRAISSSGCVINIYVNTVSTAYLTNSYGTQVLSGSAMLSLKSGDVVTFRGDTSNNINGGLTAMLSYTALSIKRISGPNQIAASETIAASYSSSVNKSPSTTVPVDFDTKEFDTHGMVTGTGGSSWRATAPLSGLYEITINQIYLTSGTAYFGIYKNGVFVKTISYATTNVFAEGTLPIQLIAGDYVDIRPNGATTVRGGALSTPASEVAKIYIKRVGL